jgi:FKBP-type peptidyl-prolyl cis-trans isomerase FklB
MKYVLATIVSIGLLCTSSIAGEKLELKDPVDKQSYSLGYQFGQSLKSQELDINLEVYTSALRDGLKGTKPLLSQEEISTIVGELQKRMIARRKALMQRAEKNPAEGKAPVEEKK